MKKLIAPLALFIATLLAPSAFAEDNRPQATGLLKVTNKDGSTELYRVDNPKAGTLNAEEQQALITEITSNAANKVKDLGALSAEDRASQPRAACWFGGGYSTIQFQQQTVFYGGCYNYQPVYYQPIWQIQQPCQQFIGGCYTTPQWNYYGGCHPFNNGCRPWY